MRTHQAKFEGKIFSSDSEWNIEFIDRIDNQYKVYLNGYNQPYHKSEIYHDNKPLIKKDQEIKLSGFLDPGENTVVVKHIDLGSPSYIHFKLIRTNNGESKIVHEIKETNKGSSEYTFVIRN